MIRRGSSRHCKRKSMITSSTTKKKAGPKKEILKPGNQVKVHLQGKWRRAVVRKHLHEPRSYQVETDDGKRYRRNRMHINRNYGLPMTRRELFRTMQAIAPSTVNNASTATRDTARPSDESTIATTCDDTTDNSTIIDESASVVDEKSNHRNGQRTMSRYVY